MAVQSLDAEMAGAADAPPFSNGFEGESWMAYWCTDCTRDLQPPGCVLLDVALLGKTPAAWETGTPADLKFRYLCKEYLQIPGR